MDNEQEQRERVRDEARKWLATPYHHRASVNGHGCDCAQLLVRAFSGAGLIEPFEPEVYTKDWHLHRGEEKYLQQVERVLRRVDDNDASFVQRGKGTTFKTGDVLMFRLGRTYSHSAMVTDFPRVIHAYAPSRIVEEVDLRGTPMSYRPMLVYSFWGGS